MIEKFPGKTGNLESCFPFLSQRSEKVGFALFRNGFVENGGSGFSNAGLCEFFSGL
jgi:hypothetical protein